ncbi:hypothetical protein ACS0TY_002395 [Phlomoides rotata]
MNCHFRLLLNHLRKIELLQLHSLTIKMGYIENSYVSSSLISSYAQNDLVSDTLIFVGSEQYEKTQELYAKMENPDSISWNLLIAACSRNSDYNESFELFDHMRKSQVYPDKYTFVSLFNVCTKLCNLALGRSLHGLIVKTNFKICDTFVCNTVMTCMENVEASRVQLRSLMG